MSVIAIKKNTLLAVLAIFVFVFIIFKFTTSFGMQHYYKLDFSVPLGT